MLNIIQYQGSLNLGCEYLKTIAIWSTNSLQEKTKLFEYPGLNFTYGVENLILYQCLKIPTSAMKNDGSQPPEDYGKWQHDTATKWRLVFIMRLLEGEIPPLQNEDWFLSSSYLKGTLHHYKMKMVFICFSSSSYLKGTLPKGNFPPYKMRLGFYVCLPMANSLATKWHSIFKGLSATETLKTYKMQFPCCGYNMPGPSPFFHLNLSPEMPLKRGTRPPIL